MVSEKTSLGKNIPICFSGQHLNWNRRSWPLIIPVVLSAQKIIAKTSS